MLILISATASAQRLGNDVRIQRPFAWGPVPPASAADAPTQFGYDMVGGIGDLNGDGVEEVAVSAPGIEFSPLVPPTNISGSGRVLICDPTVPGTPGMPGRPLATITLQTLLGWPANTPQTHSEFGRCLEVLPDLTGDGMPELAVGAPGIGTIAAGSVFVLDIANVATTGATVLSLINGPGVVPATAGAPAFGARFGQDVAVLQSPEGWVLAVSALWVDDMGATASAVPGSPWEVPVGAGPVHENTPGGIFFFDLATGTPVGANSAYPAFQPGPTLTRATASPAFGHRIAAYPDLDGDGADELLITAPQGVGGSGNVNPMASGPLLAFPLWPNGGAVFRFFSATNLLTVMAISTNAGAAGSDYFGWDIEVIPDITGQDADGAIWPDVAIGAPLGLVGPQGTGTVTAANVALDIKAPNGTQNGYVEIVSGFVDAGVIAALPNWNCPTVYPGHGVPSCFALTVNGVNTITQSIAPTVMALAGAQQNGRFGIDTEVIPLMQGIQVVDGMGGPEVRVLLGVGEPSITTPGVPVPNPPLGVVRLFEIGRPLVGATVLRPRGFIAESVIQGPPSSEFGVKLAATRTFGSVTTADLAIASGMRWFGNRGTMLSSGFGSLAFTDLQLAAWTYMPDPVFNPVTAPLVLPLYPQSPSPVAGAVIRADFEELVLQGGVITQVFMGLSPGAAGPYDIGAGSTVANVSIDMGQLTLLAPAAVQPGPVAAGLVDFTLALPPALTVPGTTFTIQAVAEIVGPGSPLYANSFPLEATSGY